MLKLTQQRCNLDQKKVYENNSRMRLLETLNHRQPDRLVVDFGAGGQTGMGVCAVHKLRQAILGRSNYKVKVIEPYQMLGEVDEELRQALGIDVVGIGGPTTLFGFANDGWKDFEMHDGTIVQVPSNFNTRKDENGGYLIFPEGDMSAPACGLMPKNSYFFDAIIRQQPVNEEALNPADNCEEFCLLRDRDIQYYKGEVDRVYTKSDYGIYVTLPGMAFGDVALVPATWLKTPKGIRDIEEWYISTAIRQDYVYKVFEYQCDIAIKNIEKLAPVLGDKVQAVFISGTDFGTQRGLFASLETYRSLYKPFYKKINDKIHDLTNWKTFIHSCGAIYDLLPDLIEAGFDILNPVQCSAEGMDPRRLKREFGKDLVFWGGGVDTQSTLPFGNPEEVYNQVRERIEIFNEGGGFVFTSVHNIQSNVPVENIIAMFKAIKDSQNS